MQYENIVKDMWTLINKAIEKMNRPSRLFKIIAQKSVLIVVDMQNTFCAPSGALENPDAREIVNNINKLSEICRDKEIPVIWLKQEFSVNGKNSGLISFFHPNSPISERTKKPMEELVKGAEGTELWSGCNINYELDHVISKCRYSPFTPGASDLDGFLRTFNRDTLIITGVSTNICCESTARDAMMNDYKVIFVSDGTASNNQLIHEISLMNIKLFFGDIVSTAELIKEIMEA